MKRGPKPDHKADLKVASLKMENKTFRQIAMITGEDVKNVHLRYKRVVGKLSTVTK